MDDSVDVEAAKRRYCAQFEHVGCGGVPVAWENQHLCCSKCGYRQKCEPDECLGDSLCNSAWSLRIRPVQVVASKVQPTMFG